MGMEEGRGIWVWGSANEEAGKKNHRSGRKRANKREKVKDGGCFNKPVF